MRPHWTFREVHCLLGVKGVAFDFDQSLDTRNCRKGLSLRAEIAPSAQAILGTRQTVEGCWLQALPAFGQTRPLFLQESGDMLHYLPTSQRGLSRLLWPPGAGVPWALDYNWEKGCAPILSRPTPSLPSSPPTLPSLVLFLTHNLVTFLLPFCWRLQFMSWTRVPAISRLSPKTQWAGMEVESSCPNPGGWVDGWRYSRGMLG